MEQFYEITSQSRRFAECMTYWNESDKQAEKVRAFMSNHNIPSPALWKGNILYIKKCPDMPDDNFMKKTVEDNGSFYMCPKKLLICLLLQSLIQAKSQQKFARFLTEKKTMRKRGDNMTSTKYEPPCKAGDTVYVIIKDKNAREVYPCKVVKVRIANKPDYSILYLVHSDVFDFSLVVPFSDIGTTVFFSETEALKSRKEWESSMLT